jgi:hypothetical protein
MIYEGLAPIILYSEPVDQGFVFCTVVGGLVVDL